MVKMAKEGLKLASVTTAWSARIGSTLVKPSVNIPKLAKLKVRNMLYRLSFISGEIQSVSERLPDNPGVGIASEEAPKE